MFAAKQNQNQSLKMPRGLPRGDSRLLLFSFEREASAQGRGTQFRIKGWCSDDREVPRDKPMAS